VLGTGEQLPSSIGADVTTVEPELDVALEAIEFDTHEETERFLNKFYTKKS
jgi:hypothetical protein